MIETPPPPRPTSTCACASNLLSFPVKRTSSTSTTSSSCTSSSSSSNNSKDDDDDDDDDSSSDVYYNNNKNGTRMMMMGKKRRLFFLDSSRSTAATTGSCTSNNTTATSSSGCNEAANKKRVRFATGGTATTTTTIDDKTTAAAAAAAASPSSLHQIRYVEPYVTKYNRRYLFYSSLELERINGTEIRRNLMCPQLVDADERGGDGVVDDDDAKDSAAVRARDVGDLTWRGLEDYRPNNHCTKRNRHSEQQQRHQCADRTTTRYADIRSYVHVVVQQYIELLQQQQQQQEESMDDSNSMVQIEAALAIISQSLSEQNRVAARKRGIQDEYAVFPTENKMNTPNVLKTKNFNTIGCSESSSSFMATMVSFWCCSLEQVFHHYTKNGLSTSSSSSPILISLGYYVTWIVRAIMFCIFCGLITLP